MPGVVEMGDVTYRPSVEADLSGVIELLYGRREPTDVEVATWHEVLGRPDTTVYVADIDGEIVGTATFLVMANLSYDCRPTGFIEAMRVSESHRRRGVASDLLHTILDDARRAGCHKIQLLAHKRHAHDGAHDLYRSVGFEEEAAGFRLYIHDE